MDQQTNDLINKEIESNEVSLGIVPVENSSEGVINSTLNSLADHNIKICGEIYLDVHHQLASARRFNLSNKGILVGIIR